MIKVKSICSFAVLAIAVCFFSGCATMQAQSPTVKKAKAEYQKDATKNYVQIVKGQYADIVPYTIRDFVIKGIVFVESKVTIDVNGERTGSEITNFMLMKEAQKLGGDDVINIKIDEREESKVVDNYDKDAKFIDREYKKTTYIYQATALAIKYTNPIFGDKISIESKNEITTNPVEITEKVQSKSKK